MSIRTEAEENLRIIRSLMEKATVYRAISAPGALAGGLGSVIVAAYGATTAWNLQSGASMQFVWLWIGLLVAVTIVNALLLSRDAVRRGEPFVSPGMKLALRAMLPGLCGGGIATLAIGSSAPDLLASLWLLFYGISLLAASHFAPKSIRWLGVGFFSASALIVGLGFRVGQADPQWHAVRGHVIMGATFGLFHLVYAALTWPRGGAGADS